MKYFKLNKIKHFGSIILLFSFFSVFITSCETTDLDINVNPNQLSPDSADPSLVLNSIQFGFINQSYSLHTNSRSIMRHVNMFGTYAANTPSTVLNGAWATTYQIRSNKKLLEDLNRTSNIANHLGIAQLLEAYAFVNLVDFVGNAPFSESVDPNISAPNFDSGEDIYNALYTQIDDAIVNLRTANQISLQDLFYEGDLSKWEKLANTLKLRMYIQTKLVASANITADINSILTSGNYIKTPEDDFIARFGTNNDNPDVRHPDFTAAYVTGAGGTYMSNEFMNILLNDKSIQDPRLNYYIYRQTTDDPVNTSGNTILPCEGNPVYTLCYVGQGYWGRMHSDDEGIPNDNNLRSTFGVYPAGGAFDNGTDNTSTVNSNNLGGAGIYPVLLSSYVDFLLAESSLPSPAGLGTNGTSVTYLENAIRASFAKVENFAGVAMNATDIQNYIDEVVSNFGNATSDGERLNIIIKEYYLASYGNSIEAYNAYRRTGFPNNLGGSVINNTDFPRNFLIPDSELNSNDNPNLVQINRTDRVFWDTNPPGFIE